MSPAFQLLIVLACLYFGIRRGGVALCIVSGIGLATLFLIFQMKPGSHPPRQSLTSSSLPRLSLSKVSRGYIHYPRLLLGKIDYQRALGAAMQNKFLMSDVGSPTYAHAKRPPRNFSLSGRYTGASKRNRTAGLRFTRAPESNRWPALYESAALPTELCWH